MRAPTHPLVVGTLLRTLRSTALAPQIPSDCRSLITLANSGA